MEWKDPIFPWRFEHFIGAPTMTLKGRPSPEKGKAYEEYLKTLNCCFFLSPLYKYHVYSQVTAPWFSQDSSLEFTSTVTSRDF